MGEVDMGRRGPEGDRLDKYEIGFAYGLFELYKNSLDEGSKRYKKYLDYYILYSYDCRGFCTKERDYEERFNRVLETEKRYNIEYYKEGIDSPEPEEEYTIEKVMDYHKLYRKQFLKDMRNKLRKYIYKNDDMFPIKKGIDIKKLLLRFLDTYPDPSFFAPYNNGSNIWTKEIFFDILDCKGKWNEAIDYFYIRVCDDGVIIIDSLDCSLEEYENAIKAYIDEALYKGETIESFKGAYIYNVDIVFDSNSKLKQSCSVGNTNRKKADEYLKFGTYNILVNNEETDINCEFPYYGHTDKVFKVTDDNPDYSLNPFTAI